MALLRRGDLSVTEVCFAVGCSSLGTFSSRFTELVAGQPVLPERLGLTDPGAHLDADDLEFLPPAVADIVHAELRIAEIDESGTPWTDNADHRDQVRSPSGVR